jgi:hypothetical protein
MNFDKALDSTRTSTWEGGQPFVAEEPHNPVRRSERVAKPTLRPVRAPGLSLSLRELSNLTRNGGTAVQAAKSMGVERFAQVTPVVPRIKMQYTLDHDR